jgi:ketosteroid isomerase-like protein
VSSEQENNKALARRFLEATARADLDAMDEMMVPNFADRSLMPGQEPDREGGCTQRRTACPCAPSAGCVDTDLPIGKCNYARSDKSVM